MLAGGMAPMYGKENLGPDAMLRWSAIANRLMSNGNTEQQATGVANNMTREAIGQRLGIVQRNSFIQPGG